MLPPPHNVTIAQFIEFVHRPVAGLVELRMVQEPKPKTGKGKTTPVFFPSPAAAEQFVHDRVPTLQQVRSMAVHLGVVPRRVRRYEPGTGGHQDDCQTTATLWADLDFKTYARGEEEVRERLAGFEIQPSIIVASGGGLHAYWKLAEPIAAGPADDSPAKLLMIRIHTVLGSDTSVSEAARVMRLPGTHNRKDLENLKLVHVESWHPERVYVPGDFATLPQVEPAAAKTRSSTTAGTAGSLSAKASQPQIDKYAEGAFAKQIGALTLAQPGVLHAQTFKSAVNLGEFIGADRLDRGRVEDALYRAAVAAGRQDLDDTRTAIRDGIDKGLSKPNRAKMPVSGGQTGQPRPDGSTPAAVSEGDSFALGDHVELARRMLKDLSGETTPIKYDQGKLYRYHQETGLWIEVPAHDQSRIIHGFSGRLVGWGDSAKPLKINNPDVTGTLKRASDECAAPDYFVNEAPGMAFQNGFVRVTKDGATLEPHAPDNRCRFGLPFQYDPDALPMRFTRFLAEVFEGDDDAHQKIMTLQEFVGSCLIGSTTGYGKALLLLGEMAGNGKSQFIDVIDGLFPPYAKTSIPPQKFGDDKWAAALAGVRLNNVSELPPAEIINPDSFKAVITGDYIPARRLFRDPFMFRPKAGHLFSCNELPSTRDLTRGFFRRFIIIGFNNRFDERPDCVPFLGRTIASSESEMRGVAQWAIEGAVRSLQQGGFTVPASSSDLLDRWRADTDQVIQFLTDTTSYPIASTDALVQLDDIYPRYKSWARENSHSLLAKNKLGNRLRRLELWAHTKAGNGYRLNFLDSASESRGPVAYRHYSDERDAS